MIATDLLLWLPHETDDLGEAAVVYAQHEWRVIPLHSIEGDGCTCVDPDCASPGKHPRTKHGVDDATTDLHQVRKWWARWPNANVGVAMGGGLACIDVDGRRHREEIEREYGPWPFTTRALTGRVGGEHWLWIVPGGFDLRRKLASKIDIKGAGGYLVAAPSLHLSGRRYRWIVCVEPLPMPEWMLSLAVKPKLQPKQYTPPSRANPRTLTGRQRWARAGLNKEAAKIATTLEGGRNDALNRAVYRFAGIVAGGLLDEDAVRSTLRAAGIASGLSEREVDRVLR